MEIDEHDIIALDFIIDKILVHGDSIASHELTKVGLIKETDNSKIELEFRRLLTDIENYNVAQVNHYDNTWDTVEPNENTLKFQRKGGFKNLFQVELKRIERKEKIEKLETDLAISTIEANKLNKEIADKNEKNEKQNKIERCINIFIGVLNVFLLLWQILKD